MNLNVIKNRYLYFIISAILLLISIITFSSFNLNYGIDMTGGTQAEYKYNISNLNIEDVREELSQASKDIKYNNREIINSISVFKISGENKIGVTTGYDSIILSETDLESIKNNKDTNETKLSQEILGDIKEDFRKKTLEILQKYDKQLTEDSYTNIGKSFGDYIKNTAITTLIIAIVAIAIYVTHAFSGVASGISVLSFALITIATLFHDVLISTGLYIFSSTFFPEFKIDTFFVTALLTILGYSINDTIVVFDRIRSNIKTHVKKKNLEEIIELSVLDTLRRSIFTSLTLLFVLVTVFFFGPETIRGFILAMIFGTLVGTYSSIFIASPLLYEFNKNKKLSEYKEKVSNPEDKIVV